ncbi:MAG: precorrin-4 C(11)-methyltransferase [Deltaproteobacteria bacterium]|nr:precorrin-4 C(11)-methyltransferase [Deltaproteobacteria bacterium]
MKRKRSQVYFIGAGPGDPELITVKGYRCIKEADLVLYAGSLVPGEVVAHAKKDGEVVDSSSMTLEETHSKILETARAGGTVARVHTGDPSLYGAIKEQMLFLDRDDISYEIIPGVTVAFAAAAAAKVSFTLPEKAQTLILTRLAGRTSVPDREQLRDLARHNTSLAIYLSAGDPEGVVEALVAGGYAEDTPVVVAHRVGWPDERIMATCISALSETVHQAGIKKQAIFLILPGQDDDPVWSRLYSPEFSHGFRK